MPPSEKQGDGFGGGGGGGERGPKQRSAACRHALRILHWGPVVTVGLIVFIFYVTRAQVIIQGRGRVPGPVETAIYYFCVGMLTFCYFKASFGGPGHAPPQWIPKDEQERKYLQFCKRCQGYKPPRAHHCSACNQCVLKMDHHCPWINNCVGHKNHKDFYLFLTFVLFACTHSCVLLGPYTIRGAWYVFPRMHRFPAHVVLRLYQMVMAMVLALSLIVSIGCLWAQQTQSLLANMTGIEQWIVRKAEGRKRDTPFLYPYNLGWYRNVKFVLGSNPFFWILPTVEIDNCTKGSKVKDDYPQYEIREGCGKYDLTVEQLTQKKLKKERSFTVRVMSSFNVSILTSPYCIPLMCWNYGYYGTYAYPDCEEGRLSVRPGDMLLVTRVRRYWMYARKFSKPEDVSDAKESLEKTKWLERGWVPIGCLEKQWQEVMEKEISKQKIEKEKEPKTEEEKPVKDHVKVD